MKHCLVKRREIADVISLPFRMSVQDGRNSHDLRQSIFATQLQKLQVNIPQSAGNTTGDNDK